MKKFLFLFIFLSFVGFKLEAQTLRTSLSLNTGSQGDLKWSSSNDFKSQDNLQASANTYSIASHPLWSNLNGSQWINTNKTFDNDNKGEYQYQSTFELKNDAIVAINFKALADDDVEVLLDNVVILNRQWHAYLDPVFVNHQASLLKGKHIITFNVWNSQAVASGLCVSGKITNLSPVKLEDDATISSVIEN